MGSRRVGEKSREPKANSQEPEANSQQPIAFMIPCSLHTISTFRVYRLSQEVETCYREEKTDPWTTVRR